MRTIELMMNTRGVSRAKPYTKAWWDATIRPIIDAAGLTETSAYPQVSFFKGTISDDAALQLKQGLARYRNRISYGMIMSQV